MIDGKNMERYYLKDFYIFIYVAETKSLSRTAKIMRMSVSSVSKRLSWLESYFNIVLFDKTTRKVDLTNEGERFYQKILSIIDGFEVFINEIKIPDLRISVTTYTEGFESFLVDCCYRYCVDKQCDISVSSVNGEIKVVGFDQIHFVNEKLNYPHAVHRKLPPIKMGTFIHCKYINEVYVNAPADLEKIPLVYLENYSTDTMTCLTKEVEKYRFTGKGLHVSSIKKITNLLLNDKCIVTGVPTVYVKDLLNDGDIVELLPNWNIESKDVYMVWKKRVSTDVIFYELLDNLEERWINFFC